MRKNGDDETIQLVNISRPDGKVEYEYDVNRAVLRDLMAKLLPDECTTAHDEGCALVDYNYLAPHATDFEGKIIKEYEFKNYIFPLPPKITKQDKEGKQDPTWSIGILHPAIVIITHLQTLSLGNFLSESTSKNKRRAARVFCFAELYDKFYDGFEIHGRKVRVDGKTRDAMYQFNTSKVCEILLKGEGIEELTEIVQTTMDYFNGHASFVPPTI